MPKTAYLELRDELEAAQSMPQVKSAVRTFANRLGYRWFAHLSAYGSDVETMSNYPKPWQVVYHESRFAEIDPVVMVAMRAEEAFSWSADTFSLDATHEQRVFLQIAREFGVSAGTSVPLIGGLGRTSLFTLASPGRREGCRMNCPVLAAMIATLVDVHAKRCRHDEPPVHQVRLTTREKSCLNWVSKGYKDSDTAKLLGTTERTVEFHLRNARRKLMAENRTHAVALAIRQEII